LSDQARAMLAGIYGWFTEGFGSAHFVDRQNRPLEENP
jgi:hypothetical protein